MPFKNHQTTGFFKTETKLHFINLIIQKEPSAMILDGSFVKHSKTDFLCQLLLFSPKQFVVNGCRWGICIIIQLILRIGISVRYSK